MPVISFQGILCCEMAAIRLRLVAASLLLLFGGFAAGFYFGWRQGARTLGWLGAASQEHVVAELAYTQYQQAGYEQAKESLASHLAYLEQLLPAGGGWVEGQSPFLSESSLAADKTLTLARLALLEEREFGPGAGDAYWAQAEKQAAQAGWRDPGRENIRRFVERLDQSLSEPS